MSFLQCFDDSGNVNGLKFLRYRIERRNEREREQRKREGGRVPPNEEMSRKYVRNREKSEEEKDRELQERLLRGTPKESVWYKDYVLSDSCLNRRTRRGKQFRNRFRMPQDSERALVQQARDEN